MVAGSIFVVTTPVLLAPSALVEDGELTACTAGLIEWVVQDFRIAYSLNTTR